MKKVMLIFGTRPEAIKMAPLIKEIEGNENLECITCVTGQHREMLDQVLNIFNIKPDYDLNIMTKSQTFVRLILAKYHQIHLLIPITSCYNVYKHLHYIHLLIYNLHITH